MLYNVHPVIHPRYPYKVEWRFDGKRKRKFFASEKKAKAWADTKNIEAKNSGVNALTFPEERRIESQQAMTLLEPFGKTIMDAVTFAIGHWQKSAKSNGIAETIAKLLLEKKNMSERYQSDLRLRLGEFAEKFGERKCSEVGYGEIRQWLNSLTVGPVSRNNSKRALSVLFAYAMENEWCELNPAKRIKAAAVSHAKIGILTHQEAANLLVKAPGYVVAHLAIGLFCGLRRSELSRLTPSSVKMKAGLVEASVTKTRGSARRFVKIRPNLRKWLTRFPVQALTPDRFRQGFEEAIDGAELRPWKSNALRHSFCSYALAHFRDLQDLTLEMGHTNPNTLFAHYRELVTPEDAAAFWRIVPQSPTPQ